MSLSTLRQATIEAVVRARLVPNASISRPRISLLSACHASAANRHHVALKANMLESENGLVELLRDESNQDSYQKYCRRSDIKGGRWRSYKKSSSTSDDKNVMARDLIVGGVAAGLYLAHRLLSNDEDALPIVRAAEVAADAEKEFASPSPLGESISAQPEVTEMRDVEGVAAPAVEDKSEGLTESNLAAATSDLEIIVEEEELEKKSELESLKEERADTEKEVSEETSESEAETENGEEEEEGKKKKTRRIS